jgi:hypothetical protein
MGRACSTNGEKRYAYRMLVGKPEEKNHCEDQDVGGWIILKLILFTLFLDIIRRRKSQQLIYHRHKISCLI